MTKIKIITDSACDLDKSYLEELDVHMVPMAVSFGQETFADRVTITTNEFYKRLRTFPQLPNTSQITPIAYESCFSEYVKQGFHIICICFSSGLSGTYQSACIARDLVGKDNIDVVDSKGASVGFGLIVRQAALMVKEGKNIREILDKVIYMRDRMEHLFIVGNLEMLKKGGRISTTQAAIGSIINVKPILQFDDGKIIPFEKVRGEKAAIRKLLDTMKERGSHIENQVIGLNYSEDDRLCMKLKEEIEKNFGVKQFVVSEIGAAIGSYVGGGTTSVFFLRG